MKAVSIHRVEFESRAFEPGASRVVGFSGREEISRPFEFEIELRSEDPDLDLEAPLEAMATLRFETTSGDRKVHGVVAEFESCGIAPDGYVYRAILVPRLWLLGLSRESRIDRDRSVPQIVARRLDEAGIRSEDCLLEVRHLQSKREYTVQYDESSLAFVSRLLEHEGIHYHFDHSGDCERIVLADANAALPGIGDDKSVSYCSGGNGEGPIVSLSARRRRLPRRVVLHDHNEQLPHIPLQGDATVAESGWGRVCEFGAGLSEPEQGARLAEIRAQELRCAAQKYEGRGSHPFFRAGARFRQEDHYRRDFNREYVLTAVEHEYSAHEGVPVYENRFSAIPVEVPFRPARVTPSPRLHGAMRARIDGSAEGEAAEQDNQGRYRLVMPFDESGAAEGRATRPVRRVQPYGGEDRAFDFPLSKGAEVMWTCIDGNPDRPVITGTVPPPRPPGAASADSDGAMIRTPGGAMLEFGGDARGESGEAAASLPSPSRDLAGPMHMGAIDPDSSTGGGHRDTYFRVKVPHTLGNRVSYLRYGERPPDTDPIENDTVNPSTGTVGKLALLESLDLNKLNKTGTTTTNPDNWGITGILDYTDANRTTITGGNREEVIWGKSRITIKKGGLGVYDAEPVYSLDFREDWDGHWRKTEKGFVRSLSLFYGDSESLFAGFTFGAMAGLSTSLYIGGKIDLSVAAAVSANIGMNIGFNLGVNLDVSKGWDMRVANSHELKARKSVSLRVKTSSKHKFKTAAGALGLTGAALATGGVGAILAGAMVGVGYKEDIENEDAKRWTPVGVGVGVTAAGIAAAAVGIGISFVVKPEPPPETQIKLDKSSIDLLLGDSVIRIRKNAIYIAAKQVYIEGGLHVEGAITCSSNINATGNVHCTAGGQLVSPAAATTVKGMTLVMEATKAQIAGEDALSIIAELRSKIADLLAG